MKALSKKVVVLFSLLLFFCFNIPNIRCSYNSMLKKETIGSEGQPLARKLQQTGMKRMDELNQKVQRFVLGISNEEYQNRLVNRVALPFTERCADKYFVNSNMNSATFNADKNELGKYVLNARYFGKSIIELKREVFSTLNQMTKLNGRFIGISMQTEENDLGKEVIELTKYFTEWQAKNNNYSLIDGFGFLPIDNEQKMIMEEAIEAVQQGEAGNFYSLEKSLNDDNEFSLTVVEFSFVDVNKLI